MSSDSENRKVRKTYLLQNSNVDHIHLPNIFFDDFLVEDGVFVDIKINALRVIFNIFFQLRNAQFQPENRPKQLSLFENDFETEDNVFARLSIKNIDISPSGTSSQVREAYEYLVKYKMEWYKSLNSKGKEILTFGGLISTPSYEHRGQTTFLISQYWLKKIIVMSDYNTIFYNIVYKIKNNKHVLFALWLEKIPSDGTTVLFSTINRKFRLNYSNVGDFCSKFLLEVKKVLDDKNQISFNFKRQQQRISIFPRRSNRFENNNFIEDRSSFKNITRRLKYFQSRYKILDDNFEKFSVEYSSFPRSRSLIEESFKKFIDNCRKRRIPSTKYYKDKIFLDEIQRILIEKYLETTTGRKLPKGFPTII